MTVKQEHFIVGLIGLGAVAVIVYLMYESRQGQAAAVDVPSGQPAPGPTYPNAPSPTSFEVAPSPVNLTYNTFPPGFSATGISVSPPDSACGNGGCGGCGSGCDACAQAGVPVTVQRVPEQVLSVAADNLDAYRQKIPVRGVAASGGGSAGSGGSRVTFG
jgi:hypothetical protein